MRNWLKTLMGWVLFGRPGSEVAIDISPALPKGRQRLTVKGNQPFIIFSVKSLMFEKWPYGHCILL